MDFDFKVFDTDMDLDVSRDRIDEYFSVWAMHEDVFRQLAARANGINLNHHVATARLAPVALSVQGVSEPSSESVEPDMVSRNGYEMVHGNVALIELRGPMMKQASSLSGGASTVRARRAVRNAARDPDVGGILLVIDSPGGTVAGTFDLVEDIQAAAAQKPVHAYIEDLGASAAYAVASATSHISMNPTGSAGSIGTYMAIQDISGWAEQVGVKVHVIRAGEFKGAGTPGTEITEEQIAMWQERVDKLNSHFLSTVSTGRKLSMKRTQELADGRVWIGEDAVERKLVDSIGSIDDAATRISKKASSRSKRMSDSTGATITDIKGLAGIDSLSNADSFVVAQLSKGATLEQVRDALAQELALQAEGAQEEIRKAKEEAEQAKAELAKAQADAAAASEKAKQTAVASSPGFSKEDDDDIVAGKGGGNGSGAIAEWEDLVAECVGYERKMGTAENQVKQRAVERAHKKDPDLHRQYIVAVNSAAGRDAQVHF